MGETPSSFSDFLRADFLKGAEQGSNVSSGQIANVIGNSVGAYEFGVIYSAEDLNFSHTRLFYLENTVSKRFRSPWDGVWGVNLELINREKFNHNITYEYTNYRCELMVQRQ